MKTINKVLLIGNVVYDPELKTTASGKSVCSFGLATNRVWKDDKGERQSLPEFHNLVAWGQMAEFCGRYLKKGKPIHIEGYLKTRTWENDQKQRMQRTEIVIEDVVLLASSAQVESPNEPSESDPF